MSSPAACSAARRTSCCASCGAPRSPAGAFRARAVASSADIPALVSRERSSVVAIDEAQFFDQGIVEIAELLAAEGRMVILSGLDQDFLGRPFGPLPQLLALADEVTKLTAICTACGAEGARTQRLG